MGRLSRKTILTAINLMERWRGVDINTFFYEHEVEEYLGTGSKKERLLSVFQRLEQDGKEKQLRQLLLAVLGRLHAHEYTELREALVRDGLVATCSTLMEDVPVAEDTRSSLEVMIDECADLLKVGTLRHHIRENSVLFEQGKWDSSISHARQFVEQLLRDIARAIADNRGETPSLDRPAKVREYLHSSGFLDNAEKKKLTNGVYGFFSEEGSHPGISTQSAARVCMHVLWAFSFYVLEKFKDWRRKHAC